MNFLLIFLIPLCGIIVAAFLVKLFPKAQFSGYDILPFFFIVACQLLTQETKQPSFLPYGFLLYLFQFILQLKTKTFRWVRHLECYGTI